ncbi:DUF1801 domain-containing protein [Piscinibacter sakaiensis]|uniref:YdhG-like domain-containing protein n=1 Tax=Piscinibacter sakaiensis TaxID=1547922 RepID=A0A0K8P6N6_PISS1|nr:DUF1801 domain-containing protein [Piscinibacter sakaiensis]GAP38276.1 hypothetical protein ISF6_4734 [Piscinibacter sakaiensis]
MTAAKTKPKPTSVDELLREKARPEQLADCQALMDVLQRVTGAPPVLWSGGIVGYGRYGYRYDSGRTGEAALVGFAVRGRELVVYLGAGAEGPAQAALLARLGPHRAGKGCLYLRRLAELDLGVLEALVAGAVAETRRRHPDGGAG